MGEDIDFFAEAALASSIDNGGFFDEASECESVVSDDENEFGANLLLARANNARSRICRLPCGDIHLCDDDCQFATHCDDRGFLVCAYTGRMVSRVCEARTDFSTGRSTWSADPDVNSGVPTNAYRKKRDMGKASIVAFQDARAFDDSQMPVAQQSTKQQKPTNKRGALCVDASEPAQIVQKRVRSSKKNVQEQDTRRMLMVEAQATLVKLMGRPPAAVAKAAARAAAKAQQQQQPVPVPKSIDPRLLNKELVFVAALKKYLKETLANGGAPSVDDVHNIELAVEHVIADEKRRQLEAKANASNQSTNYADTSVWSLAFRTQASHLAVALWTAACQSEYLSKARRGADSFRPFCAGVFYAFKRGLTLPDGTTVVPQRDDFSEALPSSRTIATDAVAKTLHASSHRGLCTIHRAIATSGNEQQTRFVFSDAIVACKALILA